MSQSLVQFHNPLLLIAVIENDTFGRQQWSDNYGNCSYARNRCLARKSDNCNSLGNIQILPEHSLQALVEILLCGKSCSDHKHQFIDRNKEHMAAQGRIE